MNYNEFVNKSDEEKREILSNLGDVQIISLVREILDNNDGDLFKFIYDDTEDLSSELLDDCLDEYGVFSDRSGNKLKKVYNLLSSDDGDDRQVEFLNNREFDDLVILVNSLSDSEKNVFFNKLEFDKLNRFYESYNSEGKIKFLNRLDAESKASLLFGIVNVNNDDVVSQEVIDKQIEIFRGIINKKSKRESVSELSGVMECLERTGDSNKIHFALNLELKEIKLLCKSLPNSVFNGLGEEEKENFVSTFDAKIKSYNRARAKSKKERAKWLKKIKNKCLGKGIISAISDRIFSRNSEDEERENNRNNSRRNRRSNENNNEENGEPKIEVDYFTTSPIHASMTISEIRRIIASGSKTTYRHNGKIITKELLDEIQESLRSQANTQEGQQENTNEQEQAQEQEQENTNEQEPAQEQEQENTNEQEQAQEQEQENTNEQEQVQEQEQENTNEQEQAQEQEQENTNEQEQAQEQEQENTNEQEQAQEQEHENTITSEPTQGQGQQSNVSGTNKNDFVDVVKGISNVIESIEALEGSLNVDLTDVKDSFGNVVYNKVGDFFSIDTLSDKQLEVMKFILNETLNKIDQKQSGRTR